MTIDIKTNQFVLHPSGALYWRETQTWLLADIHLGKVAHFRKNGFAVPRAAEGSFYQKIIPLLSLYPVKRLLFLGDLFHSSQNNEWYLFEAWAKKQTFEMVLISGNHDLIPQWRFESLGINVHSKLEEEYFIFHHFPDQPTDLFLFCGHLHPGVKLSGVGKQQIKLPCFYHSPKQLILPAFGAFTGLHLLKPKAADKVYVSTGKEVMEIEERL
jgi:DNA ligase-associated metallophosphoesterase